MAVQRLSAKPRTLMGVLWDGSPEAADDVRRLAGMMGGRTVFEGQIAVVRLPKGKRGYHPGAWLVLDPNEPGMLVAMSPATVRRCYEIEGVSESQ